MKFIKDNKFTIIVVVFFILLALVAFQVKNIFFPNIGTGKAVYGDRLDGEVEVKDSVLDSVESGIKGNSNVDSVTARVAGKIINVLITVKDSMSIADAKTLGETSIKYFSAEQLAYYDIQVFMFKSDAVTNFPIIGYKHYSDDSFSWSKDREQTTTTE